MPGAAGAARFVANRFNPPGLPRWGESTGVDALDTFPVALDTFGALSVNIGGGRFFLSPGGGGGPTPPPITGPTPPPTVGPPPIPGTAGRGALGAGRGAWRRDEVDDEDDWWGSMGLTWTWTGSEGGGGGGVSTFRARAL